MTVVPGRVRQGFSENWHEKAQIVFTFFCAFMLMLITIAVLVILFIYLMGWSATFNTRLANYVKWDIVQQHWAALFAFPLLAFFALFIVFLTKIVSGDIKFDLGPAAISGAASEGLMWIFIFLSLIWGFSQLWNLPASDTRPTSSAPPPASDASTPRPAR
jgi:hypothetical protein